MSSDQTLKYDSKTPTHHSANLKISQFLKQPEIREHLVNEVIYQSRHGNPPWHSCLENPMDTGAWWGTVSTGSQRVGHARSDFTHTHTHKGFGPFSYMVYFRSERHLKCLFLKSEKRIVE